MVIRKLLLIALVAASGAQSITHASGVPKENAEKAESWGAWYKRNKVLVGAATGALVMASITCVASVHANQEFWAGLKPDRAFRFTPYASAQDYLVFSTAGALAGAIAAKLNVLAGAMAGGLGLAAAWGATAQHSMLKGEIAFAGILGSLIGGYINHLYNSDQPKEDKANKE